MKFRYKNYAIINLGYPIMVFAMRVITFFIYISFSGILYADSIQDIEAAIMEKRFDDARHLAYDFASQTKDSSSKAQARYYLGIAQLRLGNYAPARRIFKELIATKIPQNLEVKATLGLIDGLYLDGLYKEVLSQADNLLRNNAQSDYKSLILLKVARANLKLAKWQKAKSSLEKIVREFPDSPEFQTAEQLLKEKQFFTVQIGAYKDESAAQKLIDELKQKGEYAYIVEAAVKEGEKVYRVRVGQLAALNDAKALETKLSGLGYPTLIYP